MKKVKIIDEIMGSGKTFKAIQQMKKHKGNFMYVTPFIDEVQRVKSSLNNAYEPIVTTEKDNAGNSVTKFKRDNLLKMANQKLNIISTHQLFKSLHRNDYENFLDYDLILDEVLTPIEIIAMTKDDIHIAINEGLLFVNEETSQVTFVGDEYNGKFYASLKKFCDTSNVIYVNDQLLVWSFPPEIFKSFNSITVLTYLFEGSLLCSYFKYYNIDYEIKKMSDEEEYVIKQNIRNLLNIYEGSANNIGNHYNAFSKNRIDKMTSAELKSTSIKATNLIKRRFKTDACQNAYTTFKCFENKLSGKRYTKGFIPVNSRATNDYDHKATLLYFANRFLNPNITYFFKAGGVSVDEDQWALSELLQWIWRGCIRKNEPMNLFIPSKRMRELINDWINSSSMKVKMIQKD